jgi:hypothetical protein
MSAALTDQEIDSLANDGCRNAAGGIYATRVYEFARAIEEVVRERLAASAPVQAAAEPVPKTPQGVDDAAIYAIADRFGHRYRTADEECMSFDKHALLDFARALYTAQPVQAVSGSSLVHQSERFGEVVQQPAPSPSCPKCAELIAKAFEVIRQTHLAGLKGHVGCDKDPRGCWNVRCQLGKACARKPGCGYPYCGGNAPEWATCKNEAAR